MQLFLVATPNEPPESVLDGALFSGTISPDIDDEGEYRGLTYYVHRTTGEEAGCVDSLPELLQALRSDVADAEDHLRSAQPNYLLYVQWRRRKMYQPLPRIEKYEFYSAAEREAFQRGITARGEGEISWYYTAAAVEAVVADNRRKYQNELRTLRRSKQRKLATPKRKKFLSK